MNLRGQTSCFLNSYFADIAELIMRTMTSLDAQNHFGELIDTSQREPEMITRRGRPLYHFLHPLT